MMQKKEINEIKRWAMVFFFIILAFPYTVKAQEKVADQIVAIVGGNIILFSDVENQYVQYRMQGEIKGTGPRIKCQILENFLFQKLLLNQAQLDSMEVSDEQVESELDRRLRYYIYQFGSREKFEEFYKKSVEEFKEEFKETIREQLLVQRMEAVITENVSVTPSEVKAYFNDIPEDSIPFIESEYEIGQIMKIPPVSETEKAKALEKLNLLRKRILDGEDFEALAGLYSDDPGSAEQGGKLPTFGRGEMYPEFEAVAFSLKSGEVSEILETKVGLHIIQMIKRKGEYVDVRHILIKPEVSAINLMNARLSLDSIVNLIDSDSLTFKEAADKYSDEENKTSGGMMINQMTQTSKFAADDIDPAIFFVVDKMDVGDISKPVLMVTGEGRKAYRLLFLKSRTKPHKATLKEDYDRIQNAALEQKKYISIEKWIRNKIQTTFIHVVDDYDGCEFEHNWKIKEPG
ncbi:peptidylprolyl isomerase [Bacteroidota bacterium]